MWKLIIYLNYPGMAARSGTYRIYTLEFKTERAAKAAMRGLEGRSEISMILVNDSQ